MAYNAPAPLSSPLWAVQQPSTNYTGGNIENSTSTITKRRFDNDDALSTTSSSKSAGKFVCQLCGSHQNPTPTRKSPFSLVSFGSSSNNSFRGSSNNASRRQLSACPACDQKVCASCRHEAAVMPPMRDFAVEMLTAKTTSNGSSGGAHRNLASEQQHSRERRICKAIVAKKWICWACAKQLQLRLTTGFGGWQSDHSQQQQQQQPLTTNGTNVLRNYSFSTLSSTQTLPPLPPATTTADTNTTNSVMVHKKQQQQQRLPTDTINNNITSSSNSFLFSSGGDASSTLTDGTFRRQQQQLSSSSGNRALQQQSQQQEQIINEDKKKVAQSLQSQQSTSSSSTLTKSVKKKADESDKINMPLSTLARNQLGNKSQRDVMCDKVLLELEKPDYGLSASSSELQRHSTTQRNSILLELQRQLPHSRSAALPELHQQLLNSSADSPESTSHNRQNSIRFSKNSPHRQQQLNPPHQQRDPSPFRHVADGRGNLASPGFSRRAHHAEKILLDSVSSTKKRPELYIPSSLSRFIDQTNALKQQQQEERCDQQQPVSLSQRAMNKLTAINGGNAPHNNNLVSSSTPSSSSPPPAVPSRRRQQQQSTGVARSPPVTTSSSTLLLTEDDKTSYYSSTSLASSSSDNNNSSDKKCNSDQVQNNNMLAKTFNSNQIFPEHTSFAQLPKSNNYAASPKISSSSTTSSPLANNSDNTAEKHRASKASSKLFQRFAQSASLEDDKKLASVQQYDYNTGKTMMSSFNHNDLQTEDDTDNKNRAMTLDRAFLALRARNKQPPSSSANTITVPPALTTIQTQLPPSPTTNSKVQSNILHAFFNSLTRNSGSKDERTKPDANIVVDETTEFYLPLPRPPLQANRFASLPRMPKKAAQARSRAPLVLSAEAACSAIPFSTEDHNKRLSRTQNYANLYRDAVSQEYAAYVSTWQEIEQIQADWFDAEVRMEEAEREFLLVEREFDEFLRPRLMDGESLSVSSHSEEFYLRQKRQFKPVAKESSTTITYESDCMVTVTVPAVKSRQNFQAKYNTYNPRSAKSSFYTSVAAARSDDDEKTATQAKNFDSHAEKSLTPFNRTAVSSRSASNSTKSSASPPLSEDSATKTHVCRIVVEDTITPTLRLSRQSSLCHTSSSSAKSVASPSASTSSVISTSPRSSTRGEKFSYPATATTTTKLTTSAQNASSSSSALVGESDLKTTITISAQNNTLNSKTLPRNSSITSADCSAIEAIKPAVSKTLSSSLSTSSIQSDNVVAQQRRQQHVAAMVERILRGEQPNFLSTPKTAPPVSPPQILLLENDDAACESRATAASPRAADTSRRSVTPVERAEFVEEEQPNRQLSSSPPSKPGGDDPVVVQETTKSSGSSRRSTDDDDNRVEHANNNKEEIFDENCSLSSSSSCDSSLRLSDLAEPLENVACFNSAPMFSSTIDDEIGIDSVHQLFAPNAKPVSRKSVEPNQRSSKVDSDIFLSDSATTLAPPPPTTTVTELLLFHENQPPQLTAAKLPQPPPETIGETEDEETDFYDDDDDEDGYSNFSAPTQQQPHEQLISPPRQCRKAQNTADAENVVSATSSAERTAAEDDANAAMLYAAMRLTHNDLHRLLTPIPEEEDDDDNDEEAEEEQNADPFSDVIVNDRKFSNSAVNDDDDEASTIIDEDEVSPQQQKPPLAARNDSLMDEDDLHSEYSAVGSDFEDDDDDDVDNGNTHETFPPTKNNRHKLMRPPQSINSESEMSSLELYFLADLPAQTTTNNKVPKFFN